MTTAVSPTLREEIADFVEVEARLADQHRYAEWLGLWNPARALYVVPYDWEDADESSRLAVMRDNHARLSDRIRRFESGSAHVQDPRSRLSRVISRLLIAPGDEGSLIASGNFVCVEVRMDRQVTWAGEVRYTVAPAASDSGLELWTKEVRLANIARPLSPIGFLL